MTPRLRSHGPPLLTTTATVLTKEETEAQRGFLLPPVFQQTSWSGPHLPFFSWVPVLVGMPPVGVLHYLWQLSLDHWCRTGAVEVKRAPQPRRKRGGEPGIQHYWLRLPAWAFSASSRSRADLGRVTFHESRAFPWVSALACPGPQLCPAVSKTGAGGGGGLGGGKHG